MNIIRDLLEQSKSSDYIGESISQYEHAIQCADLAQKAGADDELVIASLLHDIGHFCPSSLSNTKMGPWGVTNHEEIGANFLLSLGFSERIADLVRSHVDAKRYLVATNPAYLKSLSTASLETLKLQGGAMSEEEIKKFSVKKTLKDILRLRSWDELGKKSSYRYPQIDVFLDLINRYLAQRLH